VMGMSDSRKKYVIKRIRRLFCQNCMVIE